MDKMSRLWKIVVSVCMGIVLLGVIPVDTANAEPPYTDEDYWNNICLQSPRPDGYEDACNAYMEYLEEKNNNYQASIDEINAQVEVLKQDLEKYQNEINELNNQITAKEQEVAAKAQQIEQQQALIDAKQLEIDGKQKEIDAKQIEIDETQAQVDELSEKVKARMVQGQSSMRVNQYLDILMGASTVEEFLRIANGLNTISKYDQDVMDELVALRELLASQKEEMEQIKHEMELAKAEMEEAKQVMEEEKTVLVSQQQELMAMKSGFQQLQDEAHNQQLALQAQSSQISSQITSVNSLMLKIEAAGGFDSISANVNSSGWTIPVPGAYRSAGTWYYFGSSVEHLGLDFANSAGSPVYAVGNGVILLSVNGCSTYGYLGNWCGGAQGGGYGGGNQVFLLTVINGDMYAVQYLHLQLDSPIAAGTVVAAGDMIGRVGSSGNSTGPHCHVEITYLGDGSDFSYYATHWDGNLTFHAGYGSPYGDGRKCDAGYGAPCRVRPELFFGNGPY